MPLRQGPAGLSPSPPPSPSPPRSRWSFFCAPNDADQGFIQKIFYVHVPMAIVALCGFVAGGVLAVQHLRTRDARWDLRSYVAIHLSLDARRRRADHGLDLGEGLVGAWWVWDEPMLVSFLIVFLLYATYQPLRFSIEDRERQARYASVFAVVAGAFVPLNFARRADGRAYVHPRTLGTTTGGMPGDDVPDLPRRAGRDGAAVRDAVEVRDGVQACARPRALAARAASADEDVLAAAARAAPQRLMPALPLDEAGKYVAGAYLVFLALILIYVAIMAVEPRRAWSASIAELDELAAPRDASREPRASRCRRDERAAHPRHLAQDRAGRAARAPGADRHRSAERFLARRCGDAGGRRGRRHLDVQPHRGLRRRSATRCRPRPRCSAARRARRASGRPSWPRSCTRRATATPRASSSA